MRFAHEGNAVFGQRTQLWWDLAVIEAFHLLQKIYRIPQDEYRRRLDQFVDVLDISGQLHQPVRKLSLGQRIRCDMAAALLHRPRVLFLDEPTIGLDVVAKENVRQFLREIRDRDRVTVILTTHDLGDIEQLCRRVIIIDKGRVHFDGDLEDLRRRVGQKVRMTIELRDPVQTAELAATTGGLPVRWQEGEGRRQHAEFNRSEVPAAEVIKRLVNAAHVVDLHLAEQPIEEVVRDIYRASGRSGEPDA